MIFISIVFYLGAEIKVIARLRPGNAKRKPYEPKYIATLCIPDPEKKVYDVLEITYWPPKTKAHFMKPETVIDVGEFATFVDCFHDYCNISGLKGKKIFLTIFGKRGTPSLSLLLRNDGFWSERNISPSHLFM